MRQLVVSLILLWCLAALVPGCEENPWGPSPQSGRIEGTVTPVPSEGECIVHIKGEYLPNDGGRFFEAVLDEDGRFSMDLPTGSYTLHLDYSGGPNVYRSETGLSYDSGDQDTLVVNPTGPPARADFVLCAIDLELAPIHLPDGDDFRAAILDLESGWLESDGTVWTVYGEVVDGVATASMRWLIPDRYGIQMTFSDPAEQGGSETFLFPGVRDTASATVVDLTGGESIVLSESLEGGPASISGRISGAWLSTGASSPDVDAFSIHEQTRINRTSPDDDGDYNLLFHVPEPVKVAVSYGDSLIWIGGESYEDAEVFDLDHGVEIQDIDQAVSGIGIRFHADTWAGGLLNLELRTADTLGVVDSKTTHAIDGSMTSWIGVPPGEYTLRLSTLPSLQGQTPWFSQWYDGTQEPESATVFTVPPDGGVASLDVELIHGGMLIGSVGSIDDYWIHHVIAVSESDSVIRGQESVRWREPRFELMGLPDARYKVAYRISGTYTPGDTLQGEYVWHPGTPHWSEATVFEISGANTISGIDFNIE